MQFQWTLDQVLNKVRCLASISTRALCFGLLCRSTGSSEGWNCLQTKRGVRVMLAKGAGFRRFLPFPECYKIL